MQSHTGYGAVAHAQWQTPTIKSKNKINTPSADTRRDSDAQGSAAGYADWSSHGAWRADASSHAGSSDKSSGCSSRNSCYLHQRVEQLERSVQWMMYENGRLRDIAAQADGASPAKSDADEATTLPPMQQPSYWGLEDIPVPLQLLMQAQECEKMGLHRAGKDFSLEDSSYGTPSDEWKWFASVRDRGCERFGVSGYTAFARQGARWNFFIEGRKYCRARAVCQHCNSMVSVSSPGTGEFEAEHDEELMQFFLMTPLA